MYSKEDNYYNFMFFVISKRTFTMGLELKESAFEIGRFSHLKTLRKHRKTLNPKPYTLPPTLYLLPPTP